MKTLSQYDEQAQDFLRKTGASITFEFKRNGKYFENDEDNRDIYTVTLSRGSRKYTFDYGQSLSKSQKYVLKNNKSEQFTTNGGNLKGNLKALTTDYLKNYCKLVDGEAPSEYDILACLTKYYPGTFEDFCSEFGYDTDSRSAEKIYKSVVDEYKNLCTIFTEDEIETLCEIQ